MTIHSRHRAPRKPADAEEYCYACARPFRRNGFGQIVFHPVVLTVDGQRQFVGHDCHKKIVAAGAAGYQPELGGPRLFDQYSAPPEVLAAAGITIIRGGVS